MTQMRVVLNVFIRAIVRIFSFGERYIDCSIQLGYRLVEWTINLSASS